MKKTTVSLMALVVIMSAGKAGITDNFKSGSSVSSDVGVTYICKDTNKVGWVMLAKKTSKNTIVVSNIKGVKGASGKYKRYSSNRFSQVSYTEKEPWVVVDKLSLKGLFALTTRSNWKAEKGIMFNCKKK